MNPVIEAIASSKHLAIVGVSDKSFGGIIYKTLKKNGYAVYPVHPTRESFDGDRCLASLRDLPPHVKSAVLAVSPETADRVVDDAISAGMTHLWFQQGKDFSAAVARAQAKGIQTVSRKCILMYAQPVTGIHSVHRFLARAFGRL
jgi:predicted CoA-binding protein